MSHLSSTLTRGMSPILFLGLIVVSRVMAFADDPEASLQDPASFQRVLSRARDSESIQMLTAVLGGSQMGPGDGWFHPSLLRYDWKWLAERHDVEMDGAIGADSFQGDEESFQRLDRNRDGEIKADDFDWSSNSPYVRQMSQSGQWFRGIDSSSNGRLSREEWEKYFERVAGKKDFVTPEDLRAALFPPPPKGASGQGPSKFVLLKGLLNGELGAMSEGPDLDAPAPDFELKTQHGTKSIRLSSFREKKPVVLIFGSFT